MNQRKARLLALQEAVAALDAHQESGISYDNCREKLAGIKANLSEADVDKVAVEFDKIVQGLFNRFVRLKARVDKEEA